MLGHFQQRENTVLFSPLFLPFVLFAYLYTEMGFPFRSYFHLSALTAANELSRFETSADSVVAKRSAE